MTWADARSNGAAVGGPGGRCSDKEIAGRKGWRLPSAPELATLWDGSIAAPAIALPAGNSFTNVQNSQPYWTATESAVDSTRAWAGDFVAGCTVFCAPGEFLKTTT